MRKILLAGAAMVLAGMGSATAADILPAPIYDAPIYEAPVSQPVAAAGGWYLRGDAGYAWNKIKDPGFFQGSNANYVGFATSELRSSYSVGVGVGYQIRRYLRTDLTLDYFSKAEFRGSTTGICPGGGPCRSSDTSKVGGLSLLSNAYVDFGTYGRITPYAGAGIGGTYVSWDSMAGTSASCPGGIPCAPDVTYPGAKSWRFTYALMAGASVDVTCNLKADVGYRYRRISGGKMFGYALGVGPGYEDGMSSHEVRGGLRYSLGGCAQQEVYIEPAPIMPAVYK